MNEDEESEFIDKAVESIKVSTGQGLQVVVRYLLTPNTRRLLIEKGFFIIWMTIQTICHSGTSSRVKPYS